MTSQRIVELKEIYRRSLLEDIVPFWQRHAVDRDCGGFFTCLDRDGSVYSTDKPVWIMGRATWLFATLYRAVERREEWLSLARHGHSFLTRHCFDPSGKMYFSVTRDGRPLRMRRYYYSEVFGVLALAALARATGEESFRSAAIDLFQRLHRALRTPGAIAAKVDPDTRPSKSHTVEMVLLCVAEEMLHIDPQGPYEKVIDESVEAIFRDFVKAEDRVLLENVGPRGERIDAPEGRLINPGHAIESAWFLMEVGRRRSDRDLIRRAGQVLEWSFERGWDAEYGGLLYFVDAAGKPPEPLEHDMKLWWPHSETLYATLLAHHLTGDSQFSRMYEQVHEWTFSHFPDPEYGEWFGYLRRDGSVSSPVKGNMWKGPFHIPRALLLCWKLLQVMSNTKGPA